MADNNSKSVKTHCDDARRQIAEALPQLVRSITAKAVDDYNPSLPHAKFLIELAEFLNVAPLEKKSKPADEEEEAASAKPHRSLRDLLLDPDDDDDEL